MCDMDDMVLNLPPERVNHPTIEAHHLGDRGNRGCLKKRFYNY